MNDDGRPICKFLEPWISLRWNQCCISLTRAEILRKINNHLGWDCGKSDEIVIPKPGSSFVENEYESEEQEKEEEDGYSGAL